MDKTKDNINYRIGIDARFYGPLGKGLGRYTQEIVDGVIALDHESEYVIFLSRENFDDFVPANPRVRKVLADVRWYTLAEQFVMPRLISAERLDLIHFPHFNVPVRCPVPFVVTIHDLILTKFPTRRASTLGPLLYALKNFSYRYVISRAVNKARRIIAVSEFTKNDIAQQFGISPDRISMIYEGVSKLDSAVDSAFAAKLAPEEVLSGYCILEPYLLYVGNAYPHKNLEALIRVFLRLYERQPSLKLVLVGRDDYFYSRLKEYAASLKAWSASDPAQGPVIFPGYVPDRDLVMLFKRALLYVFPSKYEGFGLPPLEAMALGCPVASSNATCLPEILGNAARYFDPENDDAIEAVLTELIARPELSQELAERASEQVKKYDWRLAATQTLAVYHNSLV